MMVLYSGNLILIRRIGMSILRGGGFGEAKPWGTVENYNLTIKVLIVPPSKKWKR